MEECRFISQCLYRCVFGNIIVLQTAGRSGHYNPHLHILMTAGGIDPAKQWKSISYIPYEMMHRKWQYHLLNMLRNNIDDPAVEKDLDQAWKDYTKEFVAFLQPEEASNHFAESLCEMPSFVSYAALIYSKA